MRTVTMMIKPASSACDMRCTYCFYRDEAKRRKVPFQGMMSQPVLERAIAAAMSAAEESCTFLFQGGEPTLNGLAFYQNVLALEEKYARPGLTVYNSIQTNGLGLDENWAEFLAKHRFLTGLSLDGPDWLHDHSRVDAAGKGTFHRVLHAVTLLERFGADFNILCVVTGQVAQNPEPVYRFFRQQDFRYLQFIPCLDPLDSPPGDQAYSLLPEDYGNFLIRLFDLWFQELRQGVYVSVRHLDNWIGILLGLPPEACSMTGRCAIGFTVESSGDVYPCDFYALDEWRLGNVMDLSLTEMARSEPAQRFLQASHDLPQACGACRYYPLCRNGCRRDRECATGRTFLCTAYKQFFSQREQQLIQAARMIGRMRAQQTF